MLELFVVILAIFIGVRLGGIGLGTMGALGVGVLVYGFHIQPTSPPIDVILIIVAVITAVGALQAAGGIDYLVQVAESILRRNPKRIVFLGPIVSYVFSLVAGTAHVTYSILPVIAEVSKDVGVRPERPLSVSTMASHLAITASPVSAATVLLLALLSPYGIELITILLIAIPSTLLALLITAFLIRNKGKELPSSTQPLSRNYNKPLVPLKSKLAVWIFLTAVFLIILFGAFPELRPIWENNGDTYRLEMTILIEIIMLSSAAIMLLLCKVDVKNVAKQSTFIAGIQAVIAIFGIAWLGDTYFTANSSYISAIIGDWVTHYPWLFGLALFAMSVMLFSQAATIRALLPLGIALGIPPHILIALFPAVNGLFFIPSYPVELAAINFDETGTTRIGKYVLNHSFMIPGLISTLSAVVIGLLLVNIAGFVA